MGFIYELHKPTMGQTIVVLKRSYVLGSGDISVFLNGSPTLAYRETGPSEITFVSGLTDNDTVLVRYNNLNTTSYIPAHYGSGERWLNNQLYTIELSIGESNHKFSFTSRYSPLFSTVKIIRADLGDWVKDIPDDGINYLIHETSILALELWANMPDNEEEITIPYYVRQFVRYKTQIGLIKTVYLGDIRTGVYSKSLGDLDIKKDINAPDLEDLLRVISKELGPWESQLLGGGLRLTPSSAVRAGFRNQYDLNSRRSF